MQKIKAFGIHLLLSILMVGGFIIFLNLFWYQNLVRVTGVIEPLKLLILIDVILGPLLTLIVYKKGKRTLNFDLTIIVMAQLCAFIYGSYIIYQGKPSWLVFNENAFEVVYQKEVSAKEFSLQNGGAFSRPKLAFIPYVNQRLGMRAHHNFNSAIELEKKDWSVLNDHLIELKEASILTGMTITEIENKIETNNIKKMYRIGYDGLFSVMMVENENENKFSVLTRFN